MIENPIHIPPPPSTLPEGTPMVADLKPANEPVKFLDGISTPDLSLFQPINTVEMTIRGSCNLRHPGKQPALEHHLNMQRNNGLDHIRNLHPRPNEIMIIEINTPNNGSKTEYICTAADRERALYAQLDFGNPGNSTIYVENSKTPDNPNELPFHLFSGPLAKPSLNIKEPLSFDTNPNSKYSLMKARAYILAPTKWVLTNPTISRITIDQLFTQTLKNAANGQPTADAELLSIAYQLKIYAQQQKKMRLLDYLHDKYDLLEDTSVQVHFDSLISSLKAFVPFSSAGFLPKNPWCRVDRQNGRDIVKVSENEVIIGLIEKTAKGYGLRVNLEVLPAALNGLGIVIPGGGEKKKLELLPKNERSKIIVTEALREFAEEQKRQAHSATHVATVRPCELIDSVCDIVLAYESTLLEQDALKSAQMSADEQHPVNSVVLTFDELKEAILRKITIDSRLIAAVGLAEYDLNKRLQSLKVTQPE